MSLFVEDGRMALLCLSRSEYSIINYYNILLERDNANQAIECSEKMRRERR